MRIVIPFPPGGTSDILARTLAQKLTEEWGQQVIAENRPGAAGNVACEFVAKQKGDPHTLLIPGTSSVAHLEENLAAGDLVLDDTALDALA